VSNPVFLYEASQLSAGGTEPANKEKFQLFQKDLESFLGLPGGALDSLPSQPLPSHAKNASSQGGGVAVAVAVTVTVTSERFDICRDQYAPLRKELMKHATAASEWILDYFLSLPDVTVSSPQHFRRLLESWKIDPCTATRPTAASQTPSSGSLRREGNPREPMIDTTPHQPTETGPRRTILPAS
jgi:hypothetical protein